MHLIKYLLVFLTLLPIYPQHPFKDANAAEQTGITVHYKGDYADPYIYFWNPTPTIPTFGWPGVEMNQDGESDWYTYEFPTLTSVNLIFSNHGSPQTSDLSRTTGEWWYFNNRWYDQNPDNLVLPTYDQTPVITVHYKSTSGVIPSITYDQSSPSGTNQLTPTSMINEGNNWFRYAINNVNKLRVRFHISGQTSDYYDLGKGHWYVNGGRLTNFRPKENGSSGSDFREETIYFVMTARFYDGDSVNNVHCWDDAQAQNPSTDPAWRGDFKGLIDKLDYIKALGFSAIWITPIVENASGYDYHGYHAIDFTQVDPRLESANATYQDLLDAAHLKGMKIIQDIVLNHTSNFGEENLFPMFKKDYTKDDTVANLIKTDPRQVLPSDYASLNGGSQYGARISAMKEDSNDIRNIYHHEKSLQWEGYSVQTGQIAGDCVDLNTENPYVSNYLVDAYNRYIDMGVDAFRIDTVKHISRLTFNKEFVSAFMDRGGSDFYLFGEVATRYRDVWNSGIPAISTPFYTWKETKSYPWSTREEREASVFQHWNDNQNTGTQPQSGNHYLDGNNYRTLNYTNKSGMNVIDFPMHWAFKSAYDAFNMAKGGDRYYADATWNVTYIDSHDYAPDGAPEGQRFNQDQSVWAENLSLLFTFRGIPSLYYGSEIEFQKGKPIDVGPNAPLSTTGRAYFGDHIEGDLTVTDFGKYSGESGAVGTTLGHPLATHIRSLNLMRRAIPALQKGQYSTENVSGGLAFKRRFTDTNTDSFALVTVSGGATFSNIPNGTYIDAVTGDSKNVTNGTLSVSNIGMGNVRVYVLSTAKTSAPGKVAVTGTYIK
jgi:glycosidase